MSHLVVSQEEWDSFRGPPQLIYLRGPGALVRFTSADRRYGSYWGLASDFLLFLDIAKANSNDLKQRSEKLKDLARSYYAVCYDWNTLDEMYVLRIPGDGLVPCWIGPARRQGSFSRALVAKNGWRMDEVTKSVPNAVFNGGACQVLLRIDEARKSWIRGPFRAAQVSGKHLYG